MQIVTVKIDRWDGGVSDDVRDQLNGVFALTRNFDIFSNKRKMTPYRDTEADDGVDATSSDMTQFKVENFAYTNSKLFGLGRQHSGLATLKLFEKSTPTTGEWAISASVTSVNGVPDRRCFVPYKNALYGLKVSGAGTSSRADVWKYSGLATAPRVYNAAFGGADVLTLNDSSLGRVAQGIVGKDDNLYLPYENKLARTDGSTVSAGVLTLPTDVTITSMTPWGNLLGVGVKPVNGNDNSKIFFWDYVSDDITDLVDVGKGALEVIENIEGTIIGIVDSNTFGFERKVRIVQWSGGGVSELKVLTFPDTTAGLVIGKQRKGNKLYFAVRSGSSSLGYLWGIWVVGRNSPDQPFAVTFDRYVSNDSAVETLHSFFFLGEYLFASIGTNGNIRKTNDIAAYTATTIYKSQRLNAGDVGKVKELKSVSLACTPLPSGASLKLDYRVNATGTNDLASTWTQIFNETTEGAVVHEASKVEATNREFDDGYEFEFRIRSTGLAEPVEFKAVFGVIDNQVEE